MEMEVKTTMPFFCLKSEPGTISEMDRDPERYARLLEKVEECLTEHNRMNPAEEQQLVADIDYLLSDSYCLEEGESVTMRFENAGTRREMEMRNDNGEIYIVMKRETITMVSGDLI